MCLQLVFEMPLFMFWSFLNIFWNVYQYKEMERCGVPVWTTGEKQERGDILKDICITRVLLLL